MERMPAIAAVHLVGALDSLRVAEEALAAAIAALGGEDEAFDGVEADRAFELVGMQEAVKLFIDLFAGVRDRLRYPLAFHAVKRVLGEEEIPLKRAVLALQFALASMGEVIDAMDGGGAWYGPALAAHKMLGLMHAAIDCKRPRRADPGMN